MARPVQTQCANAEQVMDMLLLDASVVAISRNVLREKRCCLMVCVYNIFCSKLLLYLLPSTYVVFMQDEFLIFQSCSR